MAAVTVNSSDRRRVMGDLVMKTADVDVAADADTWDSKLRRIISWSLCPNSNSAVGATVSGGTVTFQTGGAESNLRVTVFGKE